MAAIPWPVWLAIGLFVTIVSLRLDPQLIIFAWIGVIFTLIGIAKLVAAYALSPKETKQELKTTPPYLSHTQRVTYCQRCRMTTTPHDNYCRACGQRLR